jgi:hypothetical protein
LDHPRLKPDWQLLHPFRRVEASGSLTRATLSAFLAEEERFMEEDRVYSKTQIRARHRELEQLVALQQRQLAALAKMDEAAEELDLVEREMAALERRGAEPEQAADAVSAEPEMTGERAVAVMRDDHPGLWLGARSLLGDFTRRGWIGGKDPELVLQSLRHSLRRLALHNPNVERKTEGGTHYYRYVTNSDARVPVPSVKINGTPVPALLGGPGDE